jgi:hypothetical protein
MTSAGTGAAAENARMLAALMGVEEEEAAERLQRRVLITVAATPHLAAWADEIAALVDRTVMITNDLASADVELVVGPVQALSQVRRLYADIDADGAKVAGSMVTCGKDAPHPLFAAIAACAVAGAVIHAAVDDPRLPAVSDPLVIRREDIGMPDSELAPIDLTGAVLVGAGAVAHGFLRALRHLPVCGSLDVVDPKKVGSGNPNRCLYLTEADVGLSFKAEALARNAAADFPNLALKPEVAEFKAYVAKREKTPLAIVTIDICCGSPPSIVWRA